MVDGAVVGVALTGIGDGGSAGDPQLERAAADPPRTGRNILRLYPFGTLRQDLTQINLQPEAGPATRAEVADCRRPATAHERTLLPEIRRPPQAGHGTARRGRDRDHRWPPALRANAVRRQPARANRAAGDVQSPAPRPGRPHRLPVLPHHGREGATAGIPSTETCLGCHAQVWNKSPLLDAVRASWFTGKAIPWNRVHKLPDFVYFNHAIHVNKGIGCETATAASTRWRSSSRSRRSAWAGAWSATATRCRASRPAGPDHQHDLAAARRTRPRSGPGWPSSTTSTRE